MEFGPASAIERRKSLTDLTRVKAPPLRGLGVVSIAARDGLVTVRREALKCVVASVVLVAGGGCSGGTTTPVSGSPRPGGEGDAGNAGSGDHGSSSDPGMPSGGDDAGSTPTSEASSSSGSGGDSGGGTGSIKPLNFPDIGKPVLVSDQFYFTEGPVWDPKQSVLYFTDINAQQNGTTGAIYRLTLPSTIDVFLQPDGNADGLGLDRNGNILAAGFASRSVWRNSGGVRQTLGACTSPATSTCYRGQEVNTPDDVTARSDGVIYFTDPTFGSGGQGLPSQPLPLSSMQGVYRLTRDGVVHREDTTTSGPNGVNLSPDEKILYVAYTLANTVAKFNVAADGSLSGKQAFAGASLADSMCVDAGGNLYVGTQSGLAVFNPAAKALGTISVAGQIVTNCAFGGPDQKTLFITSRAQSTLVSTPVARDSSLYKIDSMPVPGIPGQN
jgi:gluconolactonase